MDTTMNQQTTLGKAPISSRVAQIRTASGIEVWLVEDHVRPLLSVRFGFQRHVPATATERPGSVGLLTRLLLEGAGDLDSEAFRLALSEGAIDLDVQLQRDHLRGQMQCLQRDAARAFQLLALALTKPLFSDEAVARQRAQLRATISGHMRHPMGMAQDAFVQKAFRGHPYGLGAREAYDSLATLTRNDVIGAYEQVITRANALVVVIGAIDAATLSSAIDEAFGRLPAGTAAQVAPAVMQGLGHTVKSRVSTPQAAIVLGRPGIPLDDPDIAAAQVVAHAFGGGDFNSRLFAELREKRNLCYSVAMGSDLAAGMSVLLGRTSTPAEKATEACDAIQSEIARLLDGGLTAEEVDDARTFLVGATKLARVSSSAIADVLFSAQQMKKAPAWIDTSVAAIAEVTPESTARVIPRMFGDGTVLISVAAPIV